jgi:biopolymer transport protein ExbD
MTDLAHLSATIDAERRKMSPENAERLTVSLKADKKTPMGLIADVKQALQQAYALRINYSGREVK